MQKMITLLSVIVITSLFASDEQDASIRESMSMAQEYYVNIWNAGEQQNWKLADSELDKLEKTFENIEKNELENQKSFKKPSGFLKNYAHTPIIHIRDAINNKDKVSFSAVYNHLSENCAECHFVVNGKLIVTKRVDIVSPLNQKIKTTHRSINA